MLFLMVAALGPGVHTHAIFAKMRASTPSAADRAGVGVIAAAAAGDPVVFGGVRLPQLGAPPSLHALKDPRPAEPTPAGVIPTSSALAPPNSVLLSLQTLPLPDWNRPLPLLRGSHENDVRGVTNA
jgi:hypothetical protein